MSEPQEGKIKWNLLNTFIQKKLNLDSEEEDHYENWSRQFGHFQRASGLQAHGIWVDQEAALEASTSPDSFKKILASRKQMPSGDREKITKVLELIKTLCKSLCNIWIHRKSFDSCIQKQGQPFRQFYTEVVDRASRCDFGDGYCTTDKQKAVDDRILHKIVFGINNAEARQKLFEEDTLTLARARKIIEDRECLQDTERDFVNNSDSAVCTVSYDSGTSSSSCDNCACVDAINRGSFIKARNKKSGDRCNRCGHFSHRAPSDCPAMGQECGKCGKLNHYARCCRFEDEEAPQEKSASNKGKKFFPRKKMGQVICTLGGKTATKRVKVRITTSRKMHVPIRTLVDTGSDWDCFGPRHMPTLGLKLQDLNPPTRAMNCTKNATGTRMQCLGFIHSTVEFGTKSVIRDLVFYRDIETPLLSIETLEDLGIVKIYLEPSEPDMEDTDKNSNVNVTVTDPGEVHDKRPAFCQKDPSQITREDLINEFQDVFEPRTDSMKGEKFKIVLEDGAKPTKLTAPRFVAKKHLAPFKCALKELEEQEKIEKCNRATDWCHGVVITTKKNGGVRFTEDLRGLNKYVKREGGNSTSVLDACQDIDAEEGEVFSSFDAYRGHNQIGLAEESRDLTAFITPEGKYRWNVAPMGLCSISDHYNRRMNEALAAVSNFVKIVDDNLVYSKKIEEHVKHVRTFLQACRENRIHLSKEKFVFAVPEIEFAGVIISKDGYRQQDKIFASIRDFPQPKNISEMRSFHGMAQQLAPFNEKLAQILAPLRPLLSPKNTFLMDAEMIEAFENAKKELCSRDVIAFFSPDKPMSLYVDASNLNGLGFCLKQLQADGTWRPIQVGSRSLLDAERRYAPIELELTGLAWAIHKCRKFLIGTKFKVYTDHRPLVSICNRKRLDEVENQRLLRCLLKIVDFDFVVEWLPGKSNTTADCLSRSPTAVPEDDDTKLADEVSCMIATARLVAADDADYTLRMSALKETADDDLEYQLLKQQIQVGFPNHKRDLNLILHPYWQVHENLLISDDNFVLLGTRLVIPKKMRSQVLEDLHASHKGIEGTKNRARLIVYWPNVDEHIQQKCQSCELCQFDRPSLPREPIKHLPIPTRAFQILSADWFDHKGNKFLIISDWYSGWFFVRQTREADSKFFIKSLREAMCDTAAPDVIWSDQGPPFGSREVTDFLRRWGVRWQPSSPEYPQGNSYAELGVKNAKALIRKCWDGRNLDMEKWTRGMLQARNTPHKTTGLSPAILLYGHPVQDCIPAHKSSFVRSWHDEILKYDKTMAQSKVRMERYYNRGKQELSPLYPGMPVLVQNKTSKRWDRIGWVQEAHHQTRRYLIRLTSGMLIQRNRRVIRRRYPATTITGSGPGTGTDAGDNTTPVPARFSVQPRRINNREEYTHTSHDDASGGVLPPHNNMNESSGVTNSHSREESSPSTSDYISSREESSPSTPIREISRSIPTPTPGSRVTGRGRTVVAPRRLIEEKD